MRLEEYHAKFVADNPGNLPWTLSRLADCFFPGDKGRKPATRHNGGCTKVEYKVASIMGRMMKKGMVGRPRNWHPSKDVSLWVWK